MHRHFGKALQASRVPTAMNKPNPTRRARGSEIEFEKSSMSYGQQLTKQFLERLLFEPFLEEYRPDWLFGMELDFFFPSLNFAVEFNGDQHYYDTDHFGSSAKQRARDSRKRAICKERGVILLTLQAIDLQKGVIVRKLKFHLPNVKRRKVWKRQSQLERDAIAYRKSLIRNYNSPTAMKKKRVPRMLADMAARLNPSV